MSRILDLLDKVKKDRQADHQLHPQKEEASSFPWIWMGVVMLLGVSISINLSALFELKASRQLAEDLVEIVEIQKVEINQLAERMNEPEKSNLVLTDPTEQQDEKILEAIDELKLTDQLLRNKFISLNSEVKNMNQKFEMGRK